MREEENSTKPYNTKKKRPRERSHRGDLMELMTGVEPVTSSLPKAQKDYLDIDMSVVSA